MWVVSASVKAVSVAVHGIRRGRVPAHRSLSALEFSWRDAEQKGPCLEDRGSAYLPSAPAFKSRVWPAAVFLDAASEAGQDAPTNFPSSAHPVILAEVAMAARDAPACTWKLSPKAELLRFSAWSGKRDSNPRPSAWEADALPAELFPLLYGQRRFQPEHKLANGTTTLAPACRFGDILEHSGRGFKQVEAGVLPGVVLTPES